MARKIIGVIVGYFAMATFVFISFTILYLILGAEKSFEQGTYQVSSIWIILSIVLGMVGALIGGFLCVLIAKDKKAAFWLAGIVVVLGIILAIPQLNPSEEELNKVREGAVDNMEAMANAKQPPIILILNPIIGAVGVIVGSKIKKMNKQEA